MYRKPLTCSRCDHVIKPGEMYSVICNDVYCDEHAAEYTWDELETRKSEFLERVMDMLGLPILEVC